MPRPPRELLPRELVLPFRVDVLREPVVPEREDLAAPPERELPDLAAPDERLEPELADFARVEPDLLPPLLERDAPPLLLELPLALFAVERELLPRLELLRAEPELLRDEPELLRDEPELARDDEPELPLPLLEPSLHFPDMTRCAASATASAINEPSLVALDMTLVAAVDAVSAASRPASRIFLRAAGLALIAAAAAARPAASISLLIAAFASLSTLLLPPLERDDELLDLDDEERDELLRADFAIFYLPPSPTRHFKAVPVP